MDLLLDHLFGDAKMSWVEPYLESSWVKVLAAVAPSFPPPPAAGTDSDETWRHFNSAVFIGAGAVAGLGLFAAIAVVLKLCVKCKRSPQARPSTKPLICTASLTLVLVLLGVAFYWILGVAGISRATTELESFNSDVQAVQREGLSMATSLDTASRSMNATIPKCPAEWQKELQAKVQPNVESWRVTLAEFNLAIEDFPAQLNNATKLLDAISVSGSAGLVFPLALVCLCILAIVFIVCTTRGRRGRGKCSHCCIRLMGPLLFVPAVLVTTAVTAAEFGVSLSTASFCKNVDENTLTYVKKYGANESYELARYYITGVGANAFLEDLIEVNGTLGHTASTLDGIAPLLKRYCPNASEDVDSLVWNVKEIGQAIPVVDKLLAPSNIYPYYSTAVHDNACKTLISGVCWLVVFQLLVGLFCLPCLTFMADSFFERWKAWHELDAERQGLVGQEMTV